MYRKNYGLTNFNSAEVFHLDLPPLGHYFEEITNFNSNSNSRAQPSYRYTPYPSRSPNQFQENRSIPQNFNYPQSQNNPFSHTPCEFLPNHTMDYQFISPTQSNLSDIFNSGTRTNQQHPNVSSCTELCQRIVDKILNNQKVTKKQCQDVLDIHGYHYRQRDRLDKLKEGVTFIHDIERYFIQIFTF